MKSDTNQLAVEKSELSPINNDASKADIGDNDEELDEDKPEAPVSRQDLFVYFMTDKDLQHHETISIKASLYKGIAVKMKSLNQRQMENILFAVETAKDNGIVNLRFEECRIFKKAVQRLLDFCKTTSIIESLILFKATFDDGPDFKKLVEAVSSNQKIRSFAINHSVFDEDFHGKMMAKCVLDSKSIKELDLSHVIFEENKTFYEMANGLLNEKCRLQAIKLRGIAFNQLEGKVMQFILERNKSLQTLDISQASTDSPENLENVFIKFDQCCNLRTLVAENLDADFNYFAECFGSALGLNTKLEGLSLKENKLKQAQYCNFWCNMTPNRSLKKINVTKTEVTDKVMVEISEYLKQPGLILFDINLSRNYIAADGLIALAGALKENTSLTTLNLAQNQIREGGIKEFVDALKVNKTLQELCLSLNKINNAGLEAFSGFLSDNKTVQVLDLSKNVFSDNGFVSFAKELGKNTGIVSLNLSKNKDITDEAGLKELAHSLSTNSTLAIIDLTGVKIRKPCVIQYFQPALKQNITLKRIIGKVPPGIISDDLKDNITIEADVTLKYKVLKKENRRELNKLPLHRIDGLDYTLLNLMNMSNELLNPALKFIRYRRIMGVDLTNMQLEDEQLRLFAVYLEENPVLRSLSLAENLFTDDGFAQIIKALRDNTNLNHLSIDGCPAITNLSLRELEDMVTQVNMSLYSIEIEEEQFDASLIKRIQIQAKWNKAIQEHLKPVKQTTPDGLIEILFDPKAGIAQHFDSAIKSWRILGPTMIKAVNEGLTDHHVEKLCNFLANRNQIQSLNLRRNKIGNQGAKALADYIRLSDKTLISIELERNEIQDEGGEALLIATQSNMRIECCQMSYGNPMRQKICRQIEREIKANLQIKSTVFPRYKANNNSLVNYEESDRGPDFVRCALKSCELFKILHLSLPDNMIGEKEMNDIAYVLQRNTPLKTLNLSDNVVDGKAAKILANALGFNSHLREIDLRNNKLGDAGIAVLIEPFILQKILKFRNYKSVTHAKTFKQSPNAFDHGGPGNELTPNKQFLMSVQRSKMLKAFDDLATRKLKMKVERLLLNNNEQSEEALKHIYTALIANQDIDIQIDLPETEPPIFTNDSLSEDEKILLEDIDDDDEDIPHTAVAQAPVVQVKKEINEDDSQASDEDKDKKVHTPSDNEEEEQVKIIIPTCCKMRCCRPCRQICFRDKRKPKIPLSQICCRSFLIARNHATTFKMSTKLLEDSEQGLQRKIFAFIICQFLIFLGLCMILPFLIRSEQCTIVSPFAVYGGYGGFLFISTFLEVYCFMKMKGELKHQGSNSVLCSRYMIVKWCQGQLASLASFLQICFVASIAACHWNDTPEMIKQEAEEVKEEAEDVLHQQPNKIADSGLGIVLAICSILILIGSNYQKVKFVFVYISPQPHIHQIMPNTVRNAQLSWLCNFKMLAVVLESTSLSEYMISLGGPVVPGKVKHNLTGGQQDIAETLTYPIMQNRLRLQDLPMALVFTVFLIASFNSSTTIEMIIIIIYIGVTVLHALCCFIAQAWPRNAKHVNYQLVSTIIQERIEYHDQKREEKEQRQQERKELGQDPEESEEDDKSINDTEKSNGLEEVMDQLSALDKSQALAASGIEDGDKKNMTNKTDDDKDNQKSNRTNDAEPIDIGEALKKEEGDKIEGSILDINLEKSLVKLNSNKK